MSYYKDICKDVIDDINSVAKFSELKTPIFNTYCSYFIPSDEPEKSAQNIRIKLKEAFSDYPAKLKVNPFLFVDNKNPAPQVVNTILAKFGVDNFFESIVGSDLDLVFEEQRSVIKRLRKRLLHYVRRNTINYPYTVTINFYNPIEKKDIGKNNLNNNKKKPPTLWEDFLNNFLKDRHNIIHGHTLDNPHDHESIIKAKTKLEILVFAFIINVCAVSNPTLGIHD
jgi:hypothetical protein